MRLKFTTRVIATVLCLTALQGQAKVQLPACFTDNMVLQQKTKVNLWGKAAAGKKVTIITSWNNKQCQAVADILGNWKLNISTPSYGGPYTLSFSDGETTTLNNILIGEVWVCAGQSNMELTLKEASLNTADEIAAANYPEIRLLKIDYTFSTQKQTDLKTQGPWQVCTPETAGNFSSVAYFFAREIFKKKHIPIGLISSHWGGTVAEAWTSGDALKTMPAFAPSVMAMEKDPELKELNAVYEIQMSEYIAALTAKDPNYSQGTLPWIEAGFDDAAWKEMPTSSYWEKTVLPGYDGSVNFRKIINVPASWAGTDLKLNLSKIANSDVTWFNGQRVGHDQGDYKRVYVIPGKLVKAGENVIALCIVNNRGEGGFKGGPMYIAPVSNTADHIGLNDNWKYQVAAKAADLPIIPTKPGQENEPTVLFNTMINPLTNFTIKGVIWYQGESNARKAYQYRTLFPLLITDWRNKWGQGNFPFYFVQLANFWEVNKKPEESTWAELREAQAGALILPNTGMAVIIDAGEVYNIHPINKQTVGYRLAQIALAKNYGEKIIYSGPIYKSHKVHGNQVEITFNYSDGMHAKGADKLTGFALAGADRKFYWADAEIAGNKVLVLSKNVAAPVAVRYAWADNPACNLYNSAGLPASPFRTDDWPGLTYGKE